MTPETEAARPIAGVSGRNARAITTDIGCHEVHPKFSSGRGSGDGSDRRTRRNAERHRPAETAASRKHDTSRCVIANSQIYTEFRRDPNPRPGNFGKIGLSDRRTLPLHPSAGPFVRFFLFFVSFCQRNFYLCPAILFLKEMKVLTSVKELRAELDRLEQTGIGFVPTMGALHAGHRSLVERARRENATVVVSVFVNPTQFNDKNDLKHYPRTPEADARLLEEAGADFVLMPSVEEIYPEPDTRAFDFGLIDKVMEGATRPGHFNGVAQVVSRLFDIVRPARAYFGEKDFQQIAVIRAMVAQLALPVEIVECPIVRGEDGLALSSRNTLLDAEHRAAAPRIYAALKGAVERSQELTPAQLKAWVETEVEREGLLKVIYYQSVDALSMQEVNSWDDAERIQGCIAVQAGDIRLIDNIRIR